MLRKFARYGVWGLRKAYITHLRTSSLQRLAESTVYLAVKVPLSVYTGPFRPRGKHLVRYLCRTAVAEVGLGTIRLVLHSVGEPLSRMPAPQLALVCHLWWRHNMYVVLEP